MLPDNGQGTEKGIDYFDMAAAEDRGKYCAAGGLFFKLYTEEAGLLIKSLGKIFLSWYHNL